MLKKVLLAVLACITIFLSKRTMTDGHSTDHRTNAEKDATQMRPEAVPAAAMRPVRTAVLF